jgi:hypothetical protein
MKEKLETILALDELLSIAVYRVTKSNAGSDEHNLWIARRDKIVVKLEEAWQLVEAECDCCDCEVEADDSDADDNTQPGPDAE